MIIKRIFLSLLLLLLSAGILALVGAGGPTTALTTTRADYDLSWWTLDGGGGWLAGGNYTLGGTIGQPDAADALSSGDVSLYGGFWYGVGWEARYPNYLPIVIK